MAQTLQASANRWRCGGKVLATLRRRYILSALILVRRGSL